jgi:hypothetical protein
LIDPHPPVILSEVSASRSEALTQSKDPFSLNASMSPGQAFSCRPTFALAKAACVALLLTTLAAAQTLTGTVTNATTSKPAAGDEVVLLKLGQGMEEAGRTKTDAKGQFTFKLDDTQSPHLVRAIHQDVTYHRMAPPGTTSVEVQVYDVGKKIEGISVVADIMRVQTEPGKLDVMRAFAVQNASKPARTQMNERSLEFYVPEGAKVIDGSAMTAGGQPISSMPIAEGEKNRYAFIFPLRPGISQFQVAYQIPYSGSANLDPKSPYPLEHFVAILPKTMQFAAAATTAGFKPMNDPNQPDSIVQVASNTKIGQNLAFKVSGQGTLEERQEGEKGQGGQESSGAEQSSGAQANNRPGGGLGPPIDAPDPLQKYQWWILGGLAAALVIGGVYVASRQQSAARALRQQAASSPASAKSATMHLLEEEDDYPTADLVATAAPSTLRSMPAARPTSMLLEGLKEELFQLEVERRQGQISQSEYEKAKSALDQTLERALKREAQKA